LKPSEYFVLGVQRLSPLVKAPGIQALQNIAGLSGYSSDGVTVDWIYQQRRLEP